MKPWFKWLVLAGAGLALAQGPKHKETVAVIETNYGTIAFRFYGKDAPRHTENFQKLARQGFYSNTLFHRVVAKFMIQGGDPNSKDANPANDGQGGPGYTIPAEIKRKNIRGSVAAARQGDQANPRRESSGSQFYINVVDNPHLDGAYTVFGRVVSGLDVVDKIAAARTDVKTQRPLAPVIIQAVYLEERELEPDDGK